MRDSDIDVLSADALQESRPRNEAAGRLRDRIDAYSYAAYTESMHADLDAALAAERRATVERVEERVKHWPKDQALRDFLQVLREVAR